MLKSKNVYHAIAAAQSEGKTAALATIIRTSGSVPRHPGSKMLVYPDGSIVGTVGGGSVESNIIDEAKKIMKSGTPDTFSYTLNDLGAGDPGICGGTVEIFVEPIGTTPTIVVIGCGHVGKALAELAKWSGFRVVVSDDRAELCNAEFIPNMDEYLVVSPAEVMSHLTLTPQTYIAAVTRGLPVDEKLLPSILETDVPYIGLIGSHRRWKITRQTLIDLHNIDAATADRIQSPIGLEIEAETPQEIAISIMAQIIEHYRKNV